MLTGSVPHAASVQFRLRQEGAATSLSRVQLQLVDVDAAQLLARALAADTPMFSMQIKLKLEQSKEDRLAAAQRQQLLAFLNSSTE